MDLEEQVKEFEGFKLYVVPLPNKDLYDIGFAKIRFHPPVLLLICAAMLCLY